MRRVILVLLLALLVVQVCVPLTQAEEDTLFLSSVVPKPPQLEPLPPYAQPRAIFQSVYEEAAYVTGH